MRFIYLEMLGIQKKLAPREKDSNLHGREGT